MLKVLVTYTNGNSRTVETDASVVTLSAYAGVVESPLFDVASVEILSYTPDG